MTVKKTMEDVWKEMVKTHGDEGLFYGNSDMAVNCDVISSGSYALDDALGVWGFPRGHLVQFAGFESSGKTLMALSTIAEYQRSDPNGWAVFIDAEHSFDGEWAQKLGVDTKRLMVVKKSEGSKIFEWLVGVPGKPHPRTGEVKKVKLGVLDQEAEVPTGLGVIVLDSVPAMSVPMEESSKPGKANIALMARFLPPELRKLIPLLTKTGILFIAINQLRYKPDVMYGDPTGAPGGQALKHACAQMVNFGMIKNKESVIEEDGEKEGHHIRAKIEKNKKAKPFRVAEFGIKYVTGIVEKNIEVRNIGAKYGVIQRVNNTTWELDGVRYKGKDAIDEALKDEELQASVLKRAKEAKKIGKVVVIEEVEPPTETDAVDASAGDLVFTDGEGDFKDDDAM